jgi:Leucine-rich repeat (LRR) protein
MKLSTIFIYPSLTNLTHLVLSYNKIFLIQNLESFVHLTSLDLSHNEIQSIGNGLSKLTGLESFDISHNNLESVQDLKVLEHNSNLIDLKIFLNPVTENKTIYS